MAIERKTIQSGKELLALITKGASENIFSNFDIGKKGTSICLRNIDFEYASNPKLSSLEKRLITPILLNKLSISDNRKIPSKTIEFLDCSIDDSLMTFGEFDNNYKIIFRNCKFHNTIWLSDSPVEMKSFNTCTFKKNVLFRNTKLIQTFSNCVFKGKVIANDITFENKVRFRACHFKGNVNFNNTTFKELVDFWRCTFYQLTTFYKTDFMDIVVLSAATFKQDVSFTYTLIDKLLILRGTKCKQGFDLSLAIISGDLSIFDFKVRDFEIIDVFKKTKEELIENPSKDFESVYEDIYENAVSENGGIPLINKRETFRILKDLLESQRNVSESLPYKLLEKETLRKELKNKIVQKNKEETRKEKWKRVRKNIAVRLDQFNLWINRISSNHGTSYGRAFLFITLVGLLFFYVSLIFTKEFSFQLNPLKWSIGSGLKYYVQFLIPTHKFNYIGEQDCSLFYAFDFLGRIVVGYGIYQFIQAFRKYR